MNQIKQFVGNWGSLINGILILVVGSVVIWADNRYPSRSEMEAQVKYIQASVDSLRQDLQRQRESDNAKLEQQLRDVQMSVAARQQEHIDLHRLVIRLETIVERLERR